MKARFSEFTYGFALTHEIVEMCKGTLGAAPIFPSLIDEGNIGYDLKLSMRGKPVFLQFKLGHYMSRRNARERHLFLDPYFRFELTPLRHSAQHNLLMHLESAGNDVYYVAPVFYKESELNLFFKTKDVVNNSIFVSPCAIGNLPDDDYHAVCYDTMVSKVYRCSEPKGIDFQNGGVITNRIANQDTFVKIDTDYLETLFEKLLALGGGALFAGGYLKREYSPRTHDSHPNTNESLINRIAILSRTILSAEFLIVRSQE